MFTPFGRFRPDGVPEPEDPIDFGPDQAAFA